MSEPEEITTMSGQKLPLKMSVDYISFSAHTDYQQTSEFIRALKPPHVVSVGMPCLAVRCMNSGLSHTWRPPAPLGLANFDAPVSQALGTVLPFLGLLQTGRPASSVPSVCCCLSGGPRPRLGGVTVALTPAPPLPAVCLCVEPPCADL